MLPQYAKSDFLNLILVELSLAMNIDFFSNEYRFSINVY